MLVLSRKRNEAIVASLDPDALAAFREWLHRLPIDQARLTDGVELLDDLARMELHLMVVEIRGDKVRLGVEAPRDLVRVHRQEVQERIDAAAPPLRRLRREPQRGELQPV